MRPKLNVLLASLAALAAWVGEVAALSWPDGL
jgi:hypothetical protein